jgi:hypothetical protein
MLNADGKLATTDFLIRLNLEYFLAAVDGNTVTGTGVPSAALHLNYETADKICTRLRTHGYSHAHATDVLGNPITREALLDLLSTNGSATSTLPLTLAELDKIPSATMKKRMKNDSEFAKRVADLYAKAGKK